MRIPKNIALATALAALISGCSSAPVEERLAHVKIDSQEAPSFRVRHIFHFDFDSYTISENDYESLKAHANYISTSNNRALIQGSADSLGLNEYNFELGLKRAEALKNALVDLGVNPDLINVTSVGPSSPNVSARRAVITY
ncbi:OmpA family protein [Aliidiomarina quisquiliarum]|uniref:OmpA family protein n=1 Tax=Aliidiomarina quisquiliarum TaxID=2938947 RepID=UPI00208E138B|nr:OmpA family protein [Aliidiomarina quisquiliarum]MCO4320005.1 OmpA family protein [Aliidiomarina quisquiliarum]